MVSSVFYYETVFTLEGAKTSLCEVIRWLRTRFVLINLLGVLITLVVG